MKVGNNDTPLGVTFRGPFALVDVGPCYSASESPRAQTLNVFDLNPEPNTKVKVCLADFLLLVISFLFLRQQGPVFISTHSTHYLSPILSGFMPDKNLEN